MLILSKIFANVNIFKIFGFIDIIKFKFLLKGIVEDVANVYNYNKAARSGLQVLK